MRIKMATELISLFQKIGLADSVAREAAGNKKLGPMLEMVIRTVGGLKLTNKIGWSRGWNGKDARNVALQTCHGCTQGRIESVGLCHQGHHDGKIEQY